VLVPQPPPSPRSDCSCGNVRYTLEDELKLVRNNSGASSESIPKAKQTPQAPRPDTTGSACCSVQ